MSLRYSVFIIIIIIEYSYRFANEQHWYVNTMGK